MISSEFFEGFIIITGGLHLEQIARRFRDWVAAHWKSSLLETLSSSLLGLPRTKRGGTQCYCLLLPRRERRGDYRLTACLSCWPLAPHRLDSNEDGVASKLRTKQSSQSLCHETGAFYSLFHWLEPARVIKGSFKNGADGPCYFNGK